MVRKPVRVAINGAAGRVGKLVSRQCFDDPGIKVVALNDIATPAQVRRALTRDSVHGPWGSRAAAFVTHAGGVPRLMVNGKAYRLYSAKDPAQLDLRGVDVLIDATGAFILREQLEKYRMAGAKRVILTAPAKTDNDVDITVVLGVNQNMYDPTRHFLVSNASCTTNCLAPMLWVLHENFGVECADMLTVHAFTNDQRLVDGVHSDPRRARSAVCNIIPTSTGAARAIGLVIPELAGLVSGLADRVPVIDVSHVYLTALLRKPAGERGINNAFVGAANAGLRGILEYSEEPLVSSDIIGNPHSVVVDGEFTCVTGVEGRLARVTAWYDNEWAYACRLVKLAKHITRE